MSSMSSFGAVSVNSSPYFDVVSCKETSLMLLLRRGIVGGGEERRAEENGLSAIVNGEYC